MPKKTTRARTTRSKARPPKRGAARVRPRSKAAARRAPARARRRKAGAPRKTAARGAKPVRPTGRNAALDDAIETLGIMIPELSTRLAALEHLLIDKRLCVRDELKRARAFVDLWSDDS